MEVIESFTKGATHEILQAHQDFPVHWILSCGSARNVAGPRRGPPPLSVYASSTVKQVYWAPSRCSLSFIN